MTIKQKCKLCLKEKKLIKAHIIPASFYKFSSDGEPHKVLSTREGSFPKLSRTGEYDEEILCVNCDSKLGMYEQYAKDLLIQKANPKEVITHKNERVCYTVDNIDYKRFKLFLLSLLWKLDVSSREIFTAVKLGGSHERNIRQMILNENPGSDDEYSVILSKFDYDIKKVPMLHPHQIRFDNIRFYRIYLLNYIVFIKVDKGNMPSGFVNIVVKKNKPMVVLLKDYLGSNEVEIFRKIIDDSSSKFGKIF